MVVACSKGGDVVEKAHDDGQDNEVDNAVVDIEGDEDGGGWGKAEKKSGKTVSGSRRTDTTRISEDALVSHLAIFAGEGQESDVSAATAIQKSQTQPKSQSQSRYQSQSSSKQQTKNGIETETLVEKDLATEVARVGVVVEAEQAIDVEKEQKEKTAAVLGDERQFADKKDAGDNEKDMEVGGKKKELAAAYRTRCVSDKQRMLLWTMLKKKIAFLSKTQPAVAS